MKNTFKSMAVSLGNLRVNGEDYVTYAKKNIWLMQSNIYGRPVTTIDVIKKILFDIEYLR